MRVYHAKQELENRGTLNSGYVRDNMDYIQGDPYRGTGQPQPGDSYGRTYSPHNDLSPHSSRVSLQSTGSNRNARPQLNKGYDVLPGNRGSLSSQTREQPNDNYMSYSAIAPNYEEDSQGSQLPHNSRFNDNYQPSSMEPYNLSELEMNNHVPHRDIGNPGNRDSYDHGGPRYGDNSLDDKKNAMNGKPEDSFYRDSPIDNRYKAHNQQFNSPDPEDSFHGIQYTQRPHDDSYRDGAGDNYEDPYKGGNPEHRYLDEPSDDRYGGGPVLDSYHDQPLHNYSGAPDDRYGGPSDEQYRGPSDDRYEGPSDDRYGGPSDDRYGGPSDDRYEGPSDEGPSDDRYEGPSDDRYGGPSDDRYGGPSDEGPSDDRYEGPSDDRYGGPSDDRYGGPSDDRYGGPSDDRYGGPSDDRYGGPSDEHYRGPSDDHAGQADDRYGDGNSRDIREDSFVEPPADEQYLAAPSDRDADDPYRDRPPDDHYGDPSVEVERLQMNPENSQQPDQRFQEIPYRESPHADNHDKDNYGDNYEGDSLEADKDNEFIDGGPSGSHPETRYRDDDNFRGLPPSDRYHQEPQEGEPYDNYDNQDSDPYRRHDGLPPVQSDPFGDDPFQHSRGLPPGEQNRDGPLPGDRYSYEERPAEYPEQDRHTAPQGYTDSIDDRQERPPYEDDLHRTEVANVGAPPGDYHSDGRRTPSVDGRSMQWRNPDLQEVIDYLSHPNDVVKANAAAYLQHLCYMDDDMKAKTRAMDGIPPLIELLNNEFPEVHRSACGALKNLSYGKLNTDNKKLIKNAGGIPALVRLLRKINDEDVKESITGVLWNLSSCEDLKLAIIDDGVAVLVNVVIIPQSGWSQNGVVTTNVNGLLTTIFRNSTGVLRNVSSAGLEARKKLRECHGLVDSLVHSLKTAIQNRTFDNKPLENCVCLLRNLSYRIQEIQDPEFHKKRTLTLQKQKPPDKASSGCLGGSKKKSQPKAEPKKNNPNCTNRPVLELPPGFGEYQALWQSDVVRLYLQLLQESSNPVILEAASGAVQNLTACDWPQSEEIRAIVRKEKGLPNLVDLLTFDNDRVVCAAATALRNLAIDERNNQLVGKYAMKQLVSKIPSDIRQPQMTSDETLIAVMATLYEVIRFSQVFAQDFLNEGGVEKLISISRTDKPVQPKTVKYVCQLLKTMWTFKALHAEYTSRGFKEADFVAAGQTTSCPGASPPTSNVNTPYNTLNRPISGMGYDDSTMSSSRQMQSFPQENSYGYAREHDGRQDRYDRERDHRPDGRQDGYGGMNQNLSPEQDRYGYGGDRRGDEIPMQDLGLGYAPIEEQRPRTKPPVGGVPLFPNLLPPSSQANSPQSHPSEPVYAQVNKGSRYRQDELGPPLSNSRVILVDSEGQGGADSWV